MKNYKFDLIPSELDPNDYQVEAVYHTTIKLPETFDYIDELTPVRDQGEQGSCSAMSAAAIKEWQERKELGYEDYMSPQFVYNLRANKYSEGMTPRDTMKILNRVGIVPEKLYPYGSRATISNTLLKRASNFTIQGYAQVNSVFGAKASLISNGPLYIGLPVYNPKNPNFWHQEHFGQKMLGGHAVVIIGWNKNSFIIRNSWGKDWGFDGYCFYPFDEFGVHWEIWTTVDADSCMEKLDRMLNEKISHSKRKGCFGWLMGA